MNTFYSSKFCFQNTKVRLAYNLSSLIQYHAMHSKVSVPEGCTIISIALLALLIFAEANTLNNFILCIDYTASGLKIHIDFLHCVIIALYMGTTFPIIPRYLNPQNWLKCIIVKWRSFN